MKSFPLPDNLKLPTFEDIVEIHEEQLDLYGGLPGFNLEKIVGVEATLGRVLNHTDYAEDPDLLSAVAVLWHGLTEAHAFVDGNKRTALMTMAVTLEINGVTYDRGGEYAAIFIEYLFERKRIHGILVTIEEFETNLRQNTRALNPYVILPDAPEGELKDEGVRLQP